MHGKRGLLFQSSNRELKSVIKAWEATWKELRKKKLVRGGYVNTYLENSYPRAYYPSRSIYAIIKKYFPDYLVPMASEAFQQMSSICYNKGYCNLLKFALFDDFGKKSNYSLSIAEKNLIFILVEKHLIHTTWNIKVNADYVHFMTLHDMAQTDLKYTEDIVKIIRENWKEYFEKIVYPMICAFFGEEKWSGLFELNPTSTWTVVMKRLPHIEGLDSVAIRFLIQDALYYIEALDGRCYNPYWIFGSEHYEEILETVWKLKEEE